MMWDSEERQAVNFHDRLPDLRQAFLADHTGIHNGPRVGMDVVDAEHRQNIGQQSNQPQQDHGQNQALL